VVASYFGGTGRASKARGDALNSFLGGSIAFLSRGKKKKRSPGGKRKGKVSVKSPHIFNSFRPFSREKGPRSKVPRRAEEG